MSENGSEGIPQQVISNQDKAPVNGTPGVKALSREPASNSVSFKNRIARTVLGLSALFGVAAVAGDKLGAFDDHKHPVKDIGQLKTDLKNAVVGESDPIIILREHTLYDLAVRPFQQPNHPNIEAKFYKSPYAEEDEALSKEELAELGVKLDTQGNLFAQRGYKVEGKPFSEFPGQNEVGRDGKMVGRLAQITVKGQNIFVPEQFVEYGNPAPNVAQPQQ